jgi:hypothetical protein
MKKLLSNLHGSQGSVLIQVLVATGLIAGLGTLISFSLDSLTKNTKRVETLRDRERASRQIFFVLKDGAACLNTFGGNTLADGASLTSISVVNDGAGNERFTACGTVGACSSGGATEHRSRMSSGRLRLMSLSLEAYDQGSGQAQFRMSFLNASNEVKTTQRIIYIETDGTDNIIGCSTQFDNFYEAICGTLSGTFELGTGATSYCKGLWFNRTDSTSAASPYATRVDGNMQITRNFDIEGALQVGGSGSTTDFSVDVFDSTYLRSSLNIGSFNATTGVGTFVDETNNSTGKGQVENSVWVGTAARPAMAAGELRTESNRSIYVQRHILIPGFSATESFGAADPLRLTTAVTTDWVRRQIAEALASDSVSLVSIWNEIQTAATGDETNAEELLRTEFCSSLRVRDSNLATVSVSNTSDCQVLVDHLQDSEKCNVSGNCSTVRASSQICLGPTGDRFCLSSWPSMKFLATGCVSPQVIRSGSYSGYTLTNYACPRPTLVYNTGSGLCCPYRMTP